MDILYQLFMIASLHFIADYVVQTLFIAESKGDNWYHMIVHCVLYAFPFSVYYGFDWRIFLLIVSHTIIDAGKARYHVVSYTQDQIAHFIILVVLYCKF